MSQRPRDSVDWSPRVAPTPNRSPAPNASITPADRTGTDGPNPQPADHAGGPKPYLRIYFSCANAYTRAYRNPEGSAYIARCPKCGLSKRFIVGPGGTEQRQFNISC